MEVRWAVRWRADPRHGEPLANQLLIALPMREAM
jgi:hypothetical protein